MELFKYRFSLWFLLLYCARIWAQTTQAPDTNSTSAQTADQNITTSTPTTSVAPTVAPTASSDNLAAPEIQLNADLAICTCDLMQYACDINCCCDTDCIPEDRLVFSTCNDQSETSTEDSNLCTYETKVFSNYFVTTETVNNPFVFCIWRERSVARNYYSVIDPVNSSESFDSYRNQYSGYSYQYQYPTTEPSTHISNYRSGDLVVTYIQPRLGILHLPSHVAITTSCIDQTPIKFLQDTSSSCLRNLVGPLSEVCEREGSLHAHTLAGLLRNTQVKVRPDANSFPSDFVTVNVMGDTQPPIYNTAQGMCIGIIKEVSYTITHDAGVITSVETSIVTGDFRDDLIAVEQKHSVTFVKVGGDSLPLRRSGNPGYLIGEPVIAGARVDDYIVLNGDRNKYLTMITSSADGDCETDSLLRKSVVFGEDFRSGCMWKLLVGDVETCTQIQSRVLAAMLGPTRTLSDDESVYIASFGNSNPLKIGDWVKVLVSNQLSTKQCVGVYAHLEIIYTNVGSLSNPQAMIIGAQLLLESRDMPFVCLGPYCRYQNLNEAINMEMVSSVAFVDASLSSSAAIAEKPVSSSKLPANFFHPYYISDSTWLHSGYKGYCVLLSLLLWLSSLL